MKSIGMCDEIVRAFRNCQPGVWPAQPIDAGKPFKWQMRQIIKPQPNWKYPGNYERGRAWDYGTNGHAILRGWGITAGFGLAQEHRQIGFAPLGVAGDVLAVREGLRRKHLTSKEVVVYTSDGTDVPSGEQTRNWMTPTMIWHWKVEALPARYCPNAAVREHAKIMRVRVEQVQEITWHDAKTEGVTPIIPGQLTACSLDPYIYGFQQLWDFLNTKRGFGWDANPWVFAYDIMRCGDAE